MRTLVDCGCEATVHSDGSGIEITYCTTHDHAREMISILRNIVLNSKMIPDPAMSGATDCYSVPLDDLDAAKELLNLPDIGRDFPLPQTVALTFEEEAAIHKLMKKQGMSRIGILRQGLRMYQATVLGGAKFEFLHAGKLPEAE